MARYIDKDVPKAEVIFERLIGYPLANTLYEEEYEFNKAYGHQIKLKRNPLSIESCKGFIKNEVLMYEDWVDIPLETVIIHGQVLDIPPSLFEQPYKKVKVNYYAGETEVPQEAKDVVEEISALLVDDNVQAWSIPLSEKSLITINKYRKRHKGD